MQNIIKRLSKNKINLFINFLYIGLIKLLNIGSKYILVGYLIRVLGENGYGLLTWVDSIVQYSIMLVNFGFEMYAAKHVVENRNNYKKLNEVISIIIYIKLALFFLSFLLMIPIYLNEKTSEIFVITFVLMISSLGEVLMPIWYFQGIEKMKFITVITFFSKLFLVLLTLIFIKTPNDLILHIYFIVITSVFWGFSGFIAMKRESNFHFVKVSSILIFKYLKEGFFFFIGKSSIYLFHIGTLFIIGYLYEKQMVAGFDISIKIIFVFVLPFEVLQQAIFPRIVLGMQKEYLRKIIFFTFLCSTIFAIIGFVLSEQILLIFAGENMTKHTGLLKMLLVLIPVISLTLIVSNCNIIAKGYFKLFNWSLIFTALLFVIILLTLNYLGQLSFVNIIITRVIVDCVQLFIRVFYSFKYKII